MSYFRKNIQNATPYQPGFQPKETNVLKLNTNENPYPPSPAVIEAIRSVTPEQLRRYPDPTAAIFRTEAAQIHNLAPESIMCCNGGDELLSLAIRAFCDLDRPVAYPVPTYSLYPVLARLQNCPAIEVPFDNTFALPPALPKAAAPLTIVCNPNAPSGSFIDPDTIADLARRLTGALLIDEAYVDFAPENCIPLINKLDNVIILRSMSKGYSLAGLRFGYALANPELITGLMKVKNSYNVDALATAAATAAIKDQTYFRKNVEKVITQRKILTEQLKKLGFHVPQSFANFLFVKPKSCKAADIYDKLIQRNIYVRYFTDLPDHLRITVGTSQQTAGLIAALKEIMV